MIRAAMIRRRIVCVRALSKRRKPLSLVMACFGCEAVQLVLKLLVAGRIETPEP